ncbi:glycosyltransferase family 4 protein [Pedobacter panaciterrae]
MNIAFILPSLANQGPILVTKDIVAELVKRGVRCKVYYFDSITELTMDCPAEKISFFTKIPFNDYDVVHSHLFRPDLYCALNKWRMNSNTKVVTTIHTDIYKDLETAYGFWKSKIGPPLWFWAWNKMDRVAVLNTIAKINYYKGGVKEKIVVINNGRSLPEFHDEIPTSDLKIIETLKSKYTLLGTVASFDRRKGLEQILELLKSEPAYAFVIVGDGLERASLESLAMLYDLKDRFVVLGKRAQGFRYIPKFDLYVMPSRSEGMSLAMLEAVALKTAVVCSDIPVFKDIFTENEVSFFKLDDLPALRAACAFALNNKTKLINSAYERYKSQYSVTRMVDNYIRLYKNLELE